MTLTEMAAAEGYYTDTHGHTRQRGYRVIIEMGFGASYRECPLCLALVAPDAMKGHADWHAEIAPDDE